MGLTYSQKQDLIRYLSQKGNWENLFDEAFYKDKKRRWRHLNSPYGLYAIQDRKKLKAYVRHNNTGAEITIIKVGDQIRISDESGRQVRLRGSMLDHKNDPDVAILPILSSDQIRPKGEHINNDKEHNKGIAVLQIERLGVTVHFDKQTGAKKIFLEDTGQQISFVSPFAIKPAAIRLAGRFLHAVSFDEAAAKEWGLELGQLLMATKLIVARDMDIEPDLRAFNAIDSDKALEVVLEFETDEWDETWEGPWQWRPKKEKKFGDASKMERDWIDATDFEGYFVGLPRQFGIEKTDGGFSLKTFLDNRERILIHGTLLERVIEEDVRPVPLLKPEITSRSLLHMLSHGETIDDHRGRAWHYTVYKTPEAGHAAHRARELFRDCFDLTSYHFAAMSYDEDSCLLAVDGNVLERMRQAYDATVELLALIKNGSRNDERMIELLKQGASLRLTNPELAGVNRTFANLMADAGNDHLLAALKRSSGVHDLDFVPPAP